MNMTTLQKRCVELSFHNKLTHVSSVLNTVSVIDTIYSSKLKEGDPFVLGNSHAALALFVVLEKMGVCDAGEMICRHGTHACRDMDRGIWVSGGSLGQAETIAVGLALGNPKKTTWLVTSDGACMEGCIWEAMRIAEVQKVENLSVHIIYNGFGAYGPVNLRHVFSAVHTRATIHEVPTWEYPDWLQGLPGHYLTLNREQYEELMK